MCYDGSQGYFNLLVIIFVCFQVYILTMEFYQPDWLYKKVSSSKL